MARGQPLTAFLPVFQLLPSFHLLMILEPVLFQFLVLGVMYKMSQVFKILLSPMVMGKLGLAPPSQIVPDLTHDVVGRYK